MSGTTYGGTGLNQAAAHDTGLYDSNLHDNQIVALYETNAEATAAQQALISAGFSANAMHVMARDAGATSSGAAGAASNAESDGLWGSIKSLFVPDEDRTTYNTAIARGHAMLVVTPDSTMDRQHLISVLESTNPLDFDAKLEEWRQAGYNSSAGMTTATTGVAGAMGAGAIGASAISSPAPATVTAPVSGAATTATPAKTTVLPTPSTIPAAKTTATATAAAPLDNNDTIKVVEERLRVGKREVAAGAVRVRSYIVERPVEEQVTLHEEHVNIERRPVNRPAAATDLGAFQERTIEARATSEEAVVSKEARVIEEIALNKQATERVETVRDTVRKTEVEIEGGDSAATTGTLPGKVGVNPNATPGATTSGANAPRK